MKTKDEYMKEQAMKRVEVIKLPTRSAMSSKTTDMQIVAMGVDNKGPNRSGDWFTKSMQCPVEYYYPFEAVRGEPTDVNIYDEQIEFGPEPRRTQSKLP